MIHVHIQTIEAYACLHGIVIAYRENIRNGRMIRNPRFSSCSFFDQKRKAYIIIVKLKVQRKRFPSFKGKQLNKETKLPLATCAYKTNVAQINAKNHKPLIN